MYKVDVLVQGFPGKSVCHGGLGWSTITLLRGGGRDILVDVGAFGVRLDADGAPRYVGEREAGIAAWFGESVEQMTVTDLCCAAPSRSAKINPATR